MTSRNEALQAGGQAFAALLRSRDAMTPRELAEASWSPTSSHSIDDLEDLIRSERGLEPRARSA